MKTTKKIKSNQINQELEKIIEESCKPELIQESGVISRPQEDPEHIKPIKFLNEAIRILNMNKENKHNQIKQITIEYPELNREKPLNEFTTDGILTMSFPTLFPDGYGEYTILARNIGVSFKDGIKYLLKFCEYDTKTKSFNYRFC